MLDRRPSLVAVAILVAGPPETDAEFDFRHHSADKSLCEDAMGQTALVDLDRDGDLDICAKLWRPRPNNGNAGRNHFDFLENRLRK